MQTAGRARRIVLSLVIVGSIAGPAWAQVELTGDWAARLHEDAPERGGGPEVGDYLGLPINDAARNRADTWSASLWTVPEHQCIPHPADYGPNFSGVQIWKDIDPVTQEVVAYHTKIAWMTPVRTIYMDGRPHPPQYAAHTWQGFSTGKWEGDMLTVETTHLKAAYVRRNGLPRSEKATLREHFLRYGNYLTWISILTDPVFLTEPLIRTRNFQLDLGFQIIPYPCQIDVEIDRPEGVIPHYLPGTNPYLTEFATKYKLPSQATRGGAETMYPEYRRTPKALPVTLQGASNERVPIEASRTESDSEIRVVPVQGRVYMLVGPSSNTTVQVGDEGVLVVDTQQAEIADKLLAAIQTLSSKPIRYVINTHAHDDHTGGNETIAKAGRYVAGGNTREFQTGASIVAHEQVMHRMSAPHGETPASPPGNWPTDTFFVKRKDLFLNGEPVQIIHQPAAHTDGDSLVIFRRSDVVVTGDIFTPHRYPVIDAQKGGSVAGLIAALNAILEITVTEYNQEGGTMVIPGHGRLCDEADVSEYRDMVTIVRDRIQDLVKKGLTLEQVKGAKPTLDYDGVYGADSGTWTTAMFIEAMYRDLSAAPVSEGR